MNSVIERALQKIHADLLSLHAQVDALAQKAAKPDKMEYSRLEFADLVGISSSSLAKPKYYRRYGGKKRGGRIVFSAAVAEQIRKGER